MIGMMRMTIGVMGMERDNKNNKDNKDNKKDRGKDQVIGSGTLLTVTTYESWEKQKPAI